MAHWRPQIRYTSDDEERVAVFEFDHQSADLLAAFYDDATSGLDEGSLSAGDLIEVSRLFVMLHDAADWMHGDSDDQGEWEWE